MSTFKIGDIQASRDREVIDASIEVAHFHFFSISNSVCPRIVPTPENMNNLRVNLLLDGRLSLVVLCLLVIQRSCPFHCAVYVSAFQPSLLRGSSPFVRPSNKSTCFLLGVRGNEQCPPAYSSPLFSRHIEDPAPSPLVVGRPVVFDKSCAKHRKSRSRALSLSSLSSGDDIKLNKNGILAFLRRVLFWPLVR